ncbi:metallophosphoesterase family protein [Bacillus sp. PS06]|uniref:metallophosphoesterase family protein n=1 Tax=Bacillus sp. PS06 TaxID=2764176 RepID=UPI0017853189|nr:metallophosphoesterase [Bacillus sp. PS06]MBD8068886.1 metallophosphoesterase [Bacillus sp. PS06]
MKVLIVSDSHGLTDELTMLKERHKTEIDIMIHCGDSELEYHSNELNGFFRVRGNCDFDTGFPEDFTHVLGKHTLFVTHGHLYNCKMTLLNLNYRAEELGAKIVCFGHSHVAGVEMIDGTLFINPGSIRLPRMRKERTYAILSLDDNHVQVHFYDLLGQNVDSLSADFTL